MDCLKDCLQINGQQVISLIGSGGKTSLMWYLAECYRKERVLVSTTTKIGYPAPACYDYFYSEQFDQLGTDGPGITVAGRFTNEHTKLRIPPAVFRSLFAKFDKVLLEADGSKQLPLKGWETFEPVIIPETTITIGLMPIAVLGKTISSATVHRLPLFLRSTDTKAGQIILEETLANIIASPVGLWAKSRGQRILCLNQVETASQLLQARTVASLLPHSLLTRLSKVIACNIQTQEGVILWER